MRVAPPGFGGPVAAVSAEELRAISVHPRRRSIVDPPAPAKPRELIDGLRFDPVRKTFVTVAVPRVATFHFRLRLAQLLEWELEIFNAADTVATQLATLAGVDVAPLRAFLDDLAAGGEPALLRAPVPFFFVADKGGDVPREARFELGPRTTGALLAAFELDREAIASRAREARRDEDSARAERARALAAVLARHPGVPRRHPRVHWAFVNLATVDQTLAEMAQAHGVLPAALVRFEPAHLVTRYADVDHLKVRFVLNDRLELNVLDDASYWRIIERHGFPPNHEMLSGLRPILAAGYLTIERGKIVALEDDGAMIPGKLPDGLPPIAEVLPALGFPLDDDRVAASMRVIDWSGFKRAAEREQPARTSRAALAAATHGERPRLLAAHLLALRALPRERANEEAAELLRGFRLINASARAVALGELPKNADAIDATVAACLVRKALG